MLSSTPIADLSSPLAATSVDFPQIADGSGYETTILLLNTSSALESGIIKFMDSTGAPLSLRLSDGGTAASQFPYQIPTNGALRLITDGSPSDVKTGWAQLVPAVGSTPVGAGVFSLTQNGILVTESGIPAVASATEGRIYIDTSNGHYTGLAIANTSSETETVTFTAFGTDGVTPAAARSGTVTLAVNGHDAKFIDQLIPGEVAHGFRGVLVISSSSPFAVLTLRSLINSRGDFLLTTFPTADATRSAPAPIVFPRIAAGSRYQTEFILISAGANGLFATGSGSSITMSNGTIKATGANAHGVDVTYGGTITLTNVNVTTSGASSSALATDFGGETVKVMGGTIIAASTSTNSRSAGIYSTGNISVSGARVASYGDCGGVIDGANSTSLTNTALTGATRGFKLWKTAPTSGTATVSIDGGSLTATGGDAFYITGETGNAATGSITVKGGAAISASTGNIMNVVSSSTGSFTAGGVTLAGNLIADAASTITATLQNQTTLTGIAQRVAMTIDSTSVWNVTGNSVLTSLTDPSGISGLSITNITGNGYNVYYDASLAASQPLGGVTYSLVNGGKLIPKLSFLAYRDDQERAHRI